MVRAVSMCSVGRMPFFFDFVPPACARDGPRKSVMLKTFS